MVLVKLDFTKNNEQNAALKKILKIYGMPTIIFFNPEGIELSRFFGFKKKAEFLKFVEKIK